jgi:hypothetical protein
VPRLASAARRMDGQVKGKAPRVFRKWQARVKGSGAARSCQGAASSRARWQGVGEGAGRRAERVSCGAGRVKGEGRAVDRTRARHGRRQGQEQASKTEVEARSREVKQKERKSVWYWVVRENES